MEQEEVTNEMKTSIQEKLITGEKLVTAEKLIIGGKLITGEKLITEKISNSGIEELQKPAMIDYFGLTPNDLKSCGLSI